MASRPAILVKRRVNAPKGRVQDLLRTFSRPTVWNPKTLYTRFGGKKLLWSSIPREERQLWIDHALALSSTHASLVSPPNLEPNSLPSLLAHLIPDAPPEELQLLARFWRVLTPQGLARLRDQSSNANPWPTLHALAEKSLKPSVAKSRLRPERPLSYSWFFLRSNASTLRPADPSPFSSLSSDTRAPSDSRPRSSSSKRKSSKIVATSATASTPTSITYTPSVGDTTVDDANASPSATATATAVDGDDVADFISSAIPPVDAEASSEGERFDPLPPLILDRDPQVFIRRTKAALKSTHKRLASSPPSLSAMRDYAHATARALLLPYLVQHNRAIETAKREGVFELERVMAPYHRKVSWGYLEFLTEKGAAICEAAAAAAIDDLAVLALPPHAQEMIERERVEAVGLVETVRNLFFTEKLERLLQQQLYDLILDVPDHHVQAREEAAAGTSVEPTSSGGGAPQNGESAAPAEDTDEDSAAAGNVLRGAELTRQAADAVAEVSKLGRRRRSKGSGRVRRSACNLYWHHVHRARAKDIVLKSRKSNAFRVWRLKQRLKFRSGYLEDGAAAGGEEGGEQAAGEFPLGPPKLDQALTGREVEALFLESERGSLEPEGVGGTSPVEVALDIARAKTAVMARRWKRNVWGM